MGMAVMLIVARLDSRMGPWLWLAGGVTLGHHASCVCVEPRLGGLGPLAERPSFELAGFGQSQAIHPGLRASVPPGWA